MVEVSLTVGKLDASLALLLTKDHHLIEFPTVLLPNGVRAGSIVKISCERDLETETEEERRFLAVQEEILSTFGKNLPKAPILKIKNVTQTSCVLEWDPLDLGTATLKSLTLFKDGKKLGAIPQSLSNRTTKLSGLPIEKSFKFQLKLDSTAGVYMSEIVEVTTHKMTDLSGIQVCLGDITPNEQFTVDDIQQALVNMGAHHPASDKMKVETTHFVTTRENKQNPEFIKANDMNIPIIRPEWLKACEKERRIVGVRDFYVKDCVLPEILAKNYWSKPASTTAKPETPEKPVSSQPSARDSAGEESEIPALAVSAPSSDSQELITPENTPKDGSMRMSQEENNGSSGVDADSESTNKQESGDLAENSLSEKATTKEEPEGSLREKDNQEGDFHDEEPEIPESTEDNVEEEEADIARAQDEIASLKESAAEAGEPVLNKETDAGAKEVEATEELEELEELEPEESKKDVTGDCGRIREA